MASPDGLGRRVLRAFGYGICIFSGICVASTVISSVIILFDPSVGDKLIIFFSVLLVATIFGGLFVLGWWMIRASSGPGAGAARPVERVEPPAEVVTERIALTPDPTASAGTEGAVTPSDMPAVVATTPAAETGKRQVAPIAPPAPPAQGDPLLGKLKAKTPKASGGAFGDRAKKKCATLMTGQVLARFVKEGDDAYRDEYLRRLGVLGFTPEEGKQLFDYERGILTPERAERLASPSFMGEMFYDLQHVRLPESKDVYVSRQELTCSEIVKIWDEAEWHYWNSHEREMPEAVWGEIYTISRYGGGALFIEYLMEMAKRSGVEFGKVQAYSAAEQQLIFAYKWNPGKGERNPYA